MGAATDSFDTTFRGRWLERNWGAVRVALGFALSLAVIGLLVNSVYRLGARGGEGAAGVAAFADPFKTRPTPADARNVQRANQGGGEYQQLNAYALLQGADPGAQMTAAQVAPPTGDERPPASAPARRIDIDSAVAYRMREEVVNLRAMQTMPDVADLGPPAPPGVPDRREEMIAAAIETPQLPAAAPVLEQPDLPIQSLPEGEDVEWEGGEPVVWEEGEPIEAASESDPLLEPEAAPVETASTGPRAPRLRTAEFLARAASLRAPRPAPQTLEAPGDQPNAQTAALQAPPSPQATVVTPRPEQARFELQLAALDTPDQVRSRWASFQASFPRLLNGRGLRVMPVQSGGRTLHRLRVGPFATRVEAERICSALVSRGARCFVVATQSQ